MISVIIPQYHESLQMMRPLLSSLYHQRGISFEDFEVIIVNDHAPEYKPQITALHQKYPDMQIRVLITPENGGVGVARQYGLDNAKGDIVTFCDADDCLTDCFVLGMIAEQTDWNIIRTPFVEEIANAGGTHSYIEHENDGTWMHGKFYKRQFLIDNNIRFHPKMRVQEDGYFNSLAMAYSDSMYINGSPTYCWCANQRSTTRDNGNAYSYNSMHTFLVNTDILIEELINRGKELSIMRACDTLIYTLMVLGQPDWQTDDVKTHRAQIMRDIRLFARKYAQIITAVPDEYLRHIFDHYCTDGIVFKAGKYTFDKLKENIERLVA